MKEQEIWKPVVGFEKLYEVSNLGRIKSLYKEEYVIPKNRAPYVRIKQEKILSPAIFANGYCVVMLHHNSTSIKRSVHRIVAESFIPNPRELNEIDHINTIRSDNRVENLRWVTRSENHMNPITRINHSVASKAVAKKRFNSQNPTTSVDKGLKNGERKSKVSIKEQRKIVQLSLTYEYISTYDNSAAAARECGICDSQIRKCCDREMHSSAGFVWLYETDYVNGNFEKRNLNNTARRTYARAVEQYSSSGEFIKIWSCISDAAKELNVNGSHISQCCKGKERQCCGFIWKYADKTSNSLHDHE